MYIHYCFCVHYFIIRSWLLWLSSSCMKDSFLWNDIWKIWLHNHYYLFYRWKLWWRNLIRTAQNLRFQIATTLKCGVWILMLALYWVSVKTSARNDGPPKSGFSNQIFARLLFCCIFVLYQCELSFPFEGARPKVPKIGTNPGYYRFNLPVRHIHPLFFARLAYISLMVFRRTFFWREIFRRIGSLHVESIVYSGRRSINALCFSFRTG